MASKWKSLKSKLDPWAPEPAYQEKVDIAKQVYIGLSPVELARAFKMEEDKKDALEAEIKIRNMMIEALSQLIVSALESSDLQALELESGMKVTLDIKPYVSALDTTEARVLYSKWIHSKAIKGLLTLNAQTRDGFVKQLLEAGKPAPAWAKVFLKTRAKLLGKKKENSNEGDN